MSSHRATISSQPLDAAAIEASVLSESNGALVTFRGVVRDHDQGRSVTSLDYQAHPDAEAILESCCETVASSSGLAVAAAHRIGSLAVGEVALVVAVAAAHRAEAFAACEGLVDLIKQTVPIWKKQHLRDGETEWVGL
jgi:molybdopterin synthase catalytic subunit